MTSPASGPTPTEPLQVLLVDDEHLARQRMRTLLGDCTAPAAQVAAEASDAQQALIALRHSLFDVVLLDVHLPGMDGVALAQEIRDLGAAHAPDVVFVTAHAEHAVQAFELEVADYLTKPVRLARLQQALLRVQQRRDQRSTSKSLLKTEQDIQKIPGLGDGLAGKVLLIQDRGRAERVPLAEVLYLKAELKYITVRTARRSFVLDGSLNDLEAQHGSAFIRIHRNSLIARSAIRALVRQRDPDDPGGPEGWAVRLDGLDEVLTVSRRQVSLVRDAIAGRAG